MENRVNGVSFRPVVTNNNKGQRFIAEAVYNVYNIVLIF